jgi:hypothetical protein
MPTQRISDHRYPSVIAGAALILVGLANRFMGGAGSYPISGQTEKC